MNNHPDNEGLYDSIGGRSWIPRERIEFKRRDKVRISCGSVLIITEYNPHKPANCYTGVKENGLGKAYVFGPKHRPEKIGEVEETHRALQLNQNRSAPKGNFAALQFATGALVNLVLSGAGDGPQAKQLAQTLRDMGA